MSSNQDRYFKPGVMLFPLRKYLSGTQNSFIQTYVKPGMTVLDLGCGPGFFTTSLSEMVGSRGIVYAVDGDEAVMNKLRERVEKLNLNNVRHFVSSASDIPFIPDESIDFLFSNGLMCCMLNHEGAVNEMARVMKPGSMGFISVTKVLRNSDTGVSKGEWDDILNTFNIVKKGSSIMMDWAVVSKHPEN